MKKIISLTSVSLMALSLVFIPNYNGGVFCDTVAGHCFKNTAKPRAFMPL